MWRKLFHMVCLWYQEYFSVSCLWDFTGGALESNFRFHCDRAFSLFCILTVLCLTRLNKPWNLHVTVSALEYISFLCYYQRLWDWESNGDKLEEQQHCNLPVIQFYNSSAGCYILNILLQIFSHLWNEKLSEYFNTGNLSNSELEVTQIARHQILQTKQLCNKTRENAASSCGGWESLKHRQQRVKTNTQNQI